LVATRVGAINRRVCGPYYFAVHEMPKSVVTSVQNDYVSLEARIAPNA
jgi:hypothetical protein